MDETKFCAQSKFRFCGNTWCFFESFSEINAKGEPLGCPCNPKPQFGGKLCRKRLDCNLLLGIAKNLIHIGIGYFSNGDRIRAKFVDKTFSFPIPINVVGKV